MGRQRPAPGPGHQLVDVAVEVAVDRVRAAGRQRPADQRPDRQPRPVAELDPGHLAGREDHRRHRRDEQQLDDPRLRQRDVGADRVGPRPSAQLAGSSPSSPHAGRRSRRSGRRRRRRGPRRVVARRRRAPASAAQMIAPSARWSVWLQPGQVGQDLEPADDRLDREEDRRDEREPDDRPVRRAASASAATTTAATISPTTIATQRWRTWADVAVAQRREERPVHQRPVREDVPLRGRGHLRPEQEQREHRARRRTRRASVNRWLAAAAADPGRVERPDEDEDEQPDERHRRGEVGRHRLAGVVRAGRSPGRATPGSRRAATAPIDGHRRLGRSRWSRNATNARPSTTKPIERGDRPVDPLDPGLGVVERRDELAVAERPVRAAHAGIRSTRTMTPIVTSRSVIATVATASFWKRVTSSSTVPPGGRRSSSAARDGSGHSSASARSRRCTGTLSAMHSPNSMRRLIVGVLLSSRLAAVACGQPTSDAVAGRAPRPSPGRRRASSRTIISSERRRGPNRIVFSFLDATARSRSPRRTGPPSVAFTGPGGEAVTAPEPEFVWAIEGVSGVYVTHATFPVAGAWIGELHDVRARLAGADDPVQLRRQDGRQRRLAGRAGAVGRHADPRRRRRRRREDLDGRDAGPAFYETSVADALAAKKPFVLVFATPKFCQTKTCGPTLDKVKPVAAAHPDMTFINVEPYLLKDVDGQLQPVLERDEQLPGGAGDRRLRAAGRAVRVRRRRRRHRHGVVRAGLRAERDRRRARRGLS